LDLKRGDPGQTLERATVDLDPRMGEQVFAGTGHAESNCGTAATKQVTDDERTAEARSSAERPHSGDSTSDPRLSEFTRRQIRLAKGLTIHLHRLEVEANAKHAAQAREADPPNQQLDDDHHDQCVQRGQDFRA
jgi:hypothetical protein